MAGEEDLDDSKMPLLDHLIELRQRMLIAFVGFILAFFVCYGFSNHIFNFLVQPLTDLAPLTSDGRKMRIIFTALHEAFFTQIKVGFFGALCIAFPLISVQLWQFVAPGLYKNEKKAFLPFLIATPALFMLGAATVYYVVIPLAWQFFLGFQQPGGEGVLPIELEPKMNEYLSLVMRLIFAFGLSFQLPVLLTLLARVGIVSSKGLAEKRKYAIVGVFAAAAVLTPPDVITQIGLAIPILLLYEISIVCARMVEKRRAEADTDKDDPDDPEDDDDGYEDDTDFSLSR